MISKNHKDSSKAKSYNKNYKAKELTLILKIKNIKRKLNSISKATTVTNTQNME